MANAEFINHHPSHLQQMQPTVFSKVIATRLTSAFIKVTQKWDYFQLPLLCKSIYRVAQKSKPPPIFKKIVLNIANEI